MKLHGILIAYIFGIIINVGFNAYILSKSDWEITVRENEVEYEYQNDEDENFKKKITQAFS